MFPIYFVHFIVVHFPIVLFVLVLVFDVIIVVCGGDLIARVGLLVIVFWFIWVGLFIVLVVNSLSLF